MRAFRGGKLVFLIFLLFGLAAAPAKALVGPTVEAPTGAGVVMVLWSAGGRAGFCSGSVLASRLVLTAAHCVPADADLRVHYRDRAGAPVLGRIAAVARDPLYKSDAVRRRLRSIDLALLRLASPLPADFAPFALARAASATVGQRFRILGYGVAREGEGSSGGTLREGVLAARAPLSKTLLWASDPTRQGLGACSGDSGGPILEIGSSALVAIADWATGRGDKRCGELTQPAFVSPRRSWLTGVAANWGLRIESEASPQPPSP